LRFKHLSKTSEKQIENEILVFLELSGAFAWKNQTTGIYDPKIKAFRRKMNRFHLNGVADILGIWQGKPLAIEVKTEKGRLTDRQTSFLSRFIAYGGVAFVARSVADVRRELGINSNPRFNSPSRATVKDDKIALGGEPTKEITATEAHGSRSRKSKSEQRRSAQIRAGKHP
jgi:hypothetical protein